MSKASLFERCTNCDGSGLIYWGDCQDKCDACNGQGVILTDLGEEVARVIELVLDRREKAEQEKAE